MAKRSEVVVIVFATMVACLGALPWAYVAFSRCGLRFLPWAVAASAYSWYSLAGSYVFLYDGDPPGVPSNSWRGPFLDEALNKQAAVLVIGFLVAMHLGSIIAGSLESRWRRTQELREVTSSQLDVHSIRLLFWFAMAATAASYVAIPRVAYVGSYSVADSGFAFLFASVYTLFAAWVMLFATGRLARAEIVAACLLCCPLLWLGVRQPFVYLGCAVAMVAAKKARINKRLVGIAVLCLVVLGIAGLFRGEKALTGLDWKAVLLAPFQSAVFEGAYTYYNLLATLQFADMRPGTIAPFQGLIDALVQLIPSFAWPEKYENLVLLQLEQASPIELRPYGTFFGVAQVYLQGRTPAVVAFGVATGVATAALGRWLAVARSARAIGAIAFMVPLVSVYMARGTIAGAVVMMFRFVLVPALLLWLLASFVRRRERSYAKVNQRGIALRRD